WADVDSGRVNRAGRLVLALRGSCLTLFSVALLHALLELVRCAAEPASELGKLRPPEEEHYDHNCDHYQSVGTQDLGKHPGDHLPFFPKNCIQVRHIPAAPCSRGSRSFYVPDPPAR